MADANTTEVQNSTTEAAAQPDPNPAADPATGSSSSTTGAADDPAAASGAGGGAGSGDGAADGGDAATSVLGGAKTAEGDEGADGDAAEGDPANPLIGAPEGDYEITGLPEGVVPDPKVIEALAPIAKEIGISNEGMSRLAGAYNDTILPHIVGSIEQGLQTQHQTTVKEWADQGRELVKTDAVFEGKSYEDTLKVAARALDRFGGEDFRAWLDETGMGNHPALLRFAYQAGSKIKEDNDFERGGTSPREKTSAEKFYGV